MKNRAVASSLRQKVVFYLCLKLFFLQMENTSKAEDFYLTD
ncbi:hypothetical protein [Halalkalibacter oceani]|nr:hypothetical protein [Halalkalibacter oceani]